MCSDRLIILLAYSSGKLILVAVLVLVVRTPAAVNHCRSYLVFLTWYDLTSYSIVLPVSIYALVFRL